MDHTKQQKINNSSNGWSLYIGIIYRKLSHVHGQGQYQKADLYKHQLQTQTTTRNLTPTMGR